MIPSAKVGQVRLDSVATLARGVGPTIIDRYNRQFQVALTANNSASLPFDAAVREITAAIEKCRQQRCRAERDRIKANRGN